MCRDSKISSRMKLFLCVFVFMFLFSFGDGYACVNLTLQSEPFKIDSDTTLCNDIYYKTGDADSGKVIVINDSNFKLNCNGSKIIYAGGYTGVSGIKNDLGFGHNITYKNCNFYGYDKGISFSNVNNIIIQNSNFSNNNINVYFSNINDSKLENTTINSALEQGIYLFNSKNITLYNNTITQNTKSGIYLSGTTDTLIDDNDIGGNGDGELNYQISLTNSNNNNITNNSVFRDGSYYSDFGLIINSGIKNIIENNRFLIQGRGGSGEGAIKIISNLNIINNNTFEDSKKDAVIITGSSNTITKNVIKNSAGLGIKIDTAASNIIDGNTIIDSGTYGVYVAGAASSNTVISNNIIKGAPSGGIVFTGGMSSPKITNNVITKNIKSLVYGIYIIDTTYNINITGNNISYATSNALLVNNAPDLGLSTIKFNFLRNSDGLDILFTNTQNNISFLNNALTKSFTCPTGTGNTCSGNIIANLIVDDDYNQIRDYLNITDAVFTAVAGDKIFVYGGHYNESVNLTKADMTLTGETRENTVVNCTNNDYAFKLTADNITIDNFTISCASNGGGNGAGVWIYNNSYNQVLNSVIKNSTRGIYFGVSGLYSITYNLIKNILFENNLVGLLIPDGVSGANLNNITENNFSNGGWDLNISVNSNDNRVWRNNITSDTNTFAELTNNYCINGWDNWYNETTVNNPECLSNFVADWNDSEIYVNDSVRLIVNLTGETEIEQLNATIYWNGTFTNYSLSHLNGNNISGQWYFDFNDTEFLGNYNVTKLYRKDADGDVGSQIVNDVFNTKILEMNSIFEDTSRDVYDSVEIFVNVTNNASAIKNVTAYILKPDGYLDIREFRFASLKNGIYKYELGYDNTTRSGIYSINVTVYAGNIVTKNNNFMINYGRPEISITQRSLKLKNNTNTTWVYELVAIDGDLANITASLFINDSILEFTNDVWNKTENYLYWNEDPISWIVEWNITAIGTGTSYVNLTVSNNTALYPNGYYNYKNTTITVVSEPDMEAPIINNMWIENNYVEYNLNETVTIYANISDNFGVGEAFLNITHPMGFSEKITGFRVITYNDGVVKFKFEAKNITTLTNITPYVFYVNASDSSLNTNVSDVGSFNTTDVYDVNINIYDLYNRGETVNVTLDVRNVNNLSVLGFSKTINLNDTGGNTTILSGGTYYVTPSNITGVYTINTNVSKYGNSGNASKNFNITNKLIATVFTPLSSLLPVPTQLMSLNFRVSTARGDVYPYYANFVAECYLTDKGVWGNDTDTNGTYTGSNIIWITDECYAATTYNTKFNITFNINDAIYNNTGVDVHYWTTKTETSGGSSVPPGGGGGAGGAGGGGGGGGFGEPGQNTTIIIKGNATDFNFLIKPDTLIITQGTTESAVGVIDNIGDFDLNLSIDVDGICCMTTTKNYVFVKAKNKVNFPIDVYTNLTVLPSEYKIRINVFDKAEKTDTLIVRVVKNSFIDKLDVLKNYLENLKETIRHYNTVGVDTRILEEQHELLSQIILRAQLAVQNDNLKTLQAEITAAINEREKLESEIQGLKTSLWLNEYKEELVTGIISSIILFLFSTKFLMPFIWMKTELRHLRKREDELLKVRKSTEIQYFKRQIDEVTFNRIMAEKQSALTEIRTKIGDIVIAISYLKRGKFSSVESSKKYRVSSKMTYFITGFLIKIKTAFHIGVAPPESIKSQPHKIVNNMQFVNPVSESNNVSYARNNSQVLNDNLIIKNDNFLGVFALVKKKYRNWIKKKKEAKIDKGMVALEKKEKALEKKEDEIKREINELEKERQDVEKS